MTFFIGWSDLQGQGRQLGGVILLPDHLGFEEHWVLGRALALGFVEQRMWEGLSCHGEEVVFDGRVDAVVGVGEQHVELAVVKLVEVDLAMLKVQRFDQLARRVALLDVAAELVIG